MIGALVAVTIALSVPQAEPVQVASTMPGVTYVVTCKHPGFRQPVCVTRSKHPGLRGPIPPVKQAAPQPRPTWWTVAATSRR